MQAAHKQAILNASTTGTGLVEIRGKWKGGGFQGCRRVSVVEWVKFHIHKTESSGMEDYEG